MPKRSKPRGLSAGTDIVRVLWSDLYGVARGKDLAAADFPRVREHGLAFCSALMLTDLSANPADAPDTSGAGFPDAAAIPDLSTLIDLPYAPGVMCCLADLAEPGQTKAHPYAARDALRRQVAQAGKLGLAPVIGPEMEFYLCHLDPAAHHGWRPYVERDTASYVVGSLADPAGILVKLLRLCAADLGATAACHEFSAGQFEINQIHSEALNAADRAFLLRHFIKEAAAQQGLRATFLGKPFTEKSGSGFHLHVSLQTPKGGNAFADPLAADGLSAVAHHFLAGVLDHAPGLTAILNPTINSYKRLLGGALAPSAANWGYDNRTAFIRIPPERGGGARLEIRGGDAAGNPYLMMAGVIAAGLDGIARKLAPAKPITGLETTGPALPTSLGAAIVLLEKDKVLAAALGTGLVEGFCRLKRQEIARFERSVTDWEVREYAWLL